MVTDNPVLFRIQLEHLVEDTRRGRFKELHDRRLERLLERLPTKIHRCKLTLWQRICLYFKKDE